MAEVELPVAFAAKPQIMTVPEEPESIGEVTLKQLQYHITTYRFLLFQFIYSGNQEDGQRCL